jgi:DNA polymerase-3 subunit alpha
VKFVNLHGHTGHSLYDAIGSPEDHAQWMLKNAGEDSSALAITEHGNMSSAGSIVAAQKKMKDSAKFIYGVEAYYVPSLERWQKEKEKAKEEKKKKKAKSDAESELVIENESESKSKSYDLITRRNHLVLLAQNQIGLKNLFSLISRSYREGFYKKPRVDFEMLRKHSEGLIASTACLAGIPTWCVFHPDADDEDKKMQLLHQELDPFIELFGERFFLELQFNKIPEQNVTNEALIKFSKEVESKLIVTCDSHYSDPKMWKDREIYRFLGYQMQKKGVDLELLDKDINDLSAHLYLKNGDQLWDSYLETPLSNKDNHVIVREAIERTYDIAHDLIEPVSPDDSVKLPRTFMLSNEIKTSFDKLKKLVLDGLKKKNLTSKEYIDRAVYELNVIKKMGVEDYFLTKAEILNALRKEMLTGSGRGSGAGSLVCYLLDITYLDPVKNGLLFERFLSPSRAEIPDVDSDVELKDQALDILKEHFGVDNVLAISNYNRLQLRSLVKDISKLYGIGFEEVNAVTKVMESEAKDKIMDEIGHDQKLYEFTFEKAKQYSPTFKSFLLKHPDVGSHIENLFKEIRSIGRHAGGILIIPDDSCLPIIRVRGIDQSPITEGITAQHLQYFGLVKFDVLGLATLRIIRRCIEGILKSEGNENPTIDDVWDYYNKTLHPDVIDPKDQKVFKNVYHKGQFPSIFQFAEKNIQKFCKKAKPTSVDDISAISALWRPGPLKGKADERYLAARPSDIKKEHPIIQEILAETKGVLLYQEQFMLLAHKLAGFTLEEANKLRKLLVKPATSLAEEMKRERIEIGEKFVRGCIEKGLAEKRARNLWEKEILGFISYGFNKSHSECYAYNSYQCAWLFTHHKEHWIKACLESDPDLEKTINTVRELGFSVTKPDVNTSTVEEWEVKGDVCIPPLTSLKGVGATAANELVRSRRVWLNFESVQSFFFRPDGSWRWSKLNKKALQILVRIEAFESVDCVGKDKLFKNYKHMESALFDDGRYEKIKKKKLSIEDAAAMADADDWTTAEKMAIQKAIVGFYDKGLIVGKFIKIFEKYNIQAIDEAADDRNKNHIWGVVESVEQKTTKTGKPFLVISVSGLSDKPYTFRAWNATLNGPNWREGNILVFDLEYDKKWGYNLKRTGEILKVTK